MISKIRILAIGKVKEKYLLEGINEYLKRIGAFTKIEIIEFKDEGIEKESRKFEEYIDNNFYLLDDSGIQYNSLEFADFLKKKDGVLTLAIGGANGFSDSLKQRCKKISLSKMTYLHEMTRLILLEQIYRGYMIINNRNYHK